MCQYLPPVQFVTFPEDKKEAREFDGLLEGHFDHHRC